MNPRIGVSSAEWLRQSGYGQVAMESSGVDREASRKISWKKFMKRLVMKDSTSRTAPGCKTHQKDAERIAQLL